MNNFPRTTICLAGAVIAGLLFTTSAWAQTSPKMKMTTEIPSSITMPDLVDTRLVELTFFDGRRCDHPDALRQP